MVFINRKKISNKEQKKKNSSFAYTKPGEKIHSNESILVIPI
jgi:hypothetical protein